MEYKEKQEPIKEVTDKDGKKFIRKGQKVECPKVEKW